MNVAEESTAKKTEYDYGMVAIAAVCTIAALFTILFLGTMPFDHGMVGKRDYITYWATGQQLAHHGNPYDPAAILGQERDAGLKEPYFMRNVPWALPLALPLGYLSARAAALPWSLTLLCLLIVSVRITWKMVCARVIDKVNDERQHLNWLGYCFTPALFCVILGQTSIFLLFGLVLFLRLHRTRPFSAGAALWFCTLKPHLFLPFAVVLLAWIVVSRSYRVLAGALTALAAGAALTQWLAPGAFAEYEIYVRTSVMAHEFTPCLADALREIVHSGAVWLAFLPAVLGCVWGLVYYWRRRQTWDWLENGNFVVLVSLLVAPYCWPFDQCLAIPAVLLGARRTHSRALLTAVAAMCLAVGIQVNRIDLHSWAYLWPVPAWLLWYWLADRSAPKNLPAAAEF